MSTHLGDARVRSGEQASMRAKVMPHNRHWGGEKCPGGGPKGGPGVLFITLCQHESRQSPYLLLLEVLHEPPCHTYCVFPEHQPTSFIISGLHGTGPQQLQLLQ